jgi:hypothetical protein
MRDPVRDGLRFSRACARDDKEWPFGMRRRFALRLVESFE